MVIAADSRLPILFILITVTLDAMGIGLILPVMPELILEVEGGSLAGAALWGGLLTTSFAVMQFLFGPAIGNLSDRFGRRPILLVSLAVMTLDYLVMAVAGSIWALLALRLVAGVTAANHSTANAFIADISRPEQKSAHFGLIGAAFGLGFVLGPMLGGLIATFGTRAPFWAAAALAAGNLLLGLLVMPETVTDRIRRPFALARANPLGAFAEIGRLAGVRRLMAVFFLIQLANFVYPAVWPYFAAQRFDWSPAMIGLSLALFGTAMALVQGGLIRPALSRLGEVGTLRLGLAFDVVTLVAMSLIPWGMVILLLAPVSALGGLAAPALQGMMSQVTADDRQGALQGVLSSLMAVTMIVSPLLMTSVFAAFTRVDAAWQFSGAPFLLAGFLALAALLLSRPPRRAVVP